MPKRKIRFNYKKTLKITANVISYTFLTICLIILIFAISAKSRGDGSVKFFGKQARLVVTNSMESNSFTDVSGFNIKNIPINSLIFIELVPQDAEKANEWYSKLKVGDVLTFKYVYSSQQTITHRIEKIAEKSSGGYKIELVGDNKASDVKALRQTIDTSISESPNYVIGKVTGQSPFLGKIVNALKGPVGIVCIVILPCFIICVYESIRIVSVVYENKSKLDKKKSDEREREFENMKRQLEILKGKK